MVKIGDLEINPQKSKLKIPPYKFENIVLGNSPEAVFFAFENGYPIVFKEQANIFEKQIVTIKNNLLGNGKQVYLKYVYLRAIFFLYMAGLVLFEDKSIASIRREDNKIFVYGTNNWIITIEADNIHEFEEFDLSNEKEICEVIDTFEFLQERENEKRRNIHFENGWPIFEIINKNSKFPSKILLYADHLRKKLQTNRYHHFVLPNTFKTISYLSPVETTMDKYSSQEMKILLLQIFHNLGMKGRYAKTMKIKSLGNIDKDVHRKLRIKLIDREILKNNEMKEIIFNFESKNKALQQLVYQTKIWIDPLVQQSFPG